MRKAWSLWCLGAAILLFHGCASKPVSGPYPGQVPEVAGPAGGGAALEGAAGREKEGAITEENLAKTAEERRRAAEDALAHLKDVAKGIKIVDSAVALVGSIAAGDLGSIAGDVEGLLQAVGGDEEER